MAGRRDMDDILDAALDDLDDDDDDELQRGPATTGSQPLQKKAVDVGGGVQPGGAASASVAEVEGANQSPAVRAVPPDNRDEEERMLAASLEDMMAQLAKVGEEMGMRAGGEGEGAGGPSGGTGDAEAERALDDLIRQMSSQMEELAVAATASPSSSDHKGSVPKEKNSSRSRERRKETAERTTPKKAESATGSNSGAGPQTAPSPAGGVDMAVSRLLSDMARASAESSSSADGGDDMPDVPNLDAAALEGMGEDAMRSMMEEFEKFGQKGDADDVLDGMMRQLLSKELMYDPMKQVCEKFPEWLAGARDKLPTEDYERYGRQYQMFQRIVHVYETDPDNFPRLMELMQEIQEYGQPPADIVKELAPGQEFDEEGMPKMDGLGGGGLPPGMMFPPFPPGMAGEGGEQCSIM